MFSLSSFFFMMDELREFVEYNYNYNELGNDIFQS